MNNIKPPEKSERLVFIHHSCGGNWLKDDNGGENNIILFKSCYPNSNYTGSVHDPIPHISENPLRGMDCTSSHHTIEHDADQESGNHHRCIDGVIQHAIGENCNTNQYPVKVGNDHPSSAGNRKGTVEFIAILNGYYNACVKGK